MTPWGCIELDVGICEGRIAELGSLRSSATQAFLDVRGLHVLPGIIDSQVHFREPGLEHKETLSTGTAAALLGGVTTVFEMPNTVPATTSAAALADKISRAQGRAWTNYAFFIGATGDNAAQLGALERLPGCVGVKLFMGSSTGSLLVADDAGLSRVLRSGRRRLAVHAEDEGRLIERRSVAEQSTLGVKAHPEWRDELTALRATERCLSAARSCGRRVHVLHITTAEELALLGRSRTLATLEVTPQHLTLSAPECYERLGTLAQMNPPIRGRRHQRALWSAVQSGLVDVIGSDHAPHTREEKARPYPASPSGMPGVQTMLPLMLTHVHEGRLSLPRLVDLLAAGPARIYGAARKGRLLVGGDADLTIVDLQRRERLTHARMRSLCGWTPFDQMDVVGMPVAVVLGGRHVMQDGEILGSPQGQLVAFEETACGTGGPEPVLR